MKTKTETKYWFSESNQYWKICSE